MKKKNRLLVLVASLFIVLGILGGCGMSKADKSEIKNEQDRIAQYIVNHVELINGDKIKRIEFIEFQKDNVTGTWWISTTINESYTISFSEKEIGEDIRTSNYSPKEFRVIDISTSNNDITNVDIVYYGVN